MKIDANRLSMQINDTLIHQECVRRSGKYLANYLIRLNRSIDAITLLGRCAVHDISKMQNTAEFLSLASIVETIDELKNVNYTLKDEYKDAIKLHWENNSHHPEHYENPNDMSELDILEMACDCHARSKQFKSNLIEYIKIQQDLRFHFDDEHFQKLLSYCRVLTEMTISDDYSDILNQKFCLSFNLKDKTMGLLETFDDGTFSNTLTTDKLILQRVKNPDFASIVYNIFLKSGEEIGSISIKCNGVIDFVIYDKYDVEYAIDAIKKVVEVSTIKDLSISSKNHINIKSMALLNNIGFHLKMDCTGEPIYKLVKRTQN